MIMHASALNHFLTPTEREVFERTGYLIIHDAIESSLHRRLLEVVDRVDTRERQPEHGNRLLSVTDVIQEGHAMVELIDNPRVFPKLLSILGWNIYLYHSHLDVTPSENINDQTWNVAWHQDSMRVNDEIESNPRPRLSVKIGYYLTDVSAPDHGNTLVVPGSHLTNSLDCPDDGVSNPDEAIPLCLNPGDAVILDRRVWHTRSPNTAGFPRKVIWYGYSYRWMRPKDEMTVAHLYHQLSPVQRQILGDATSANSVYDPKPEDTPLKAWLEEHAPHIATASPHGTSNARPPAGGERGSNIGRN
ncbi:MAG: hypothetical protein HOB20_01610 [Planctomycetaceae bacterium]|mgnify:FL=1|jgi:ectoine hydroxylase|nr:hypothetical protein [Planctomycetaceae bacterium]